MPADEKDAMMRAFMAGELDVLVATTVIEVGIDVPNATVMVIEHAERFGLSQLHQLRGRVGRGADESYCILIATADEEAIGGCASSSRPTTASRSPSADLRLRGLGDFFGARQHGLPEFRFFQPEQDEDLLEVARADARALIASDPELARPEHERLRAVLAARYGERERLYGVG